MIPLLPFKSLSSIQDNYDVFLFDIWGVIIEAGVAYPNVVDFLNKFSKNNKVLYLTNSPRPEPQVQETLSALGVKNLQTESIFTSGAFAAEMLSNAKENFGIDDPIIFHLGNEQNPMLTSHIRGKFQITETPDKANIILLSLYRDEGENLTEFDEFLKNIAVRKHIVNVCMNPDTVVPAGQGHIRYCSGYFAEKIENFGGKVIYTGKPKVEIYNKLLSTLTDVSKDRILMIGDTIDKDVQGAINAGIHSALTLSGNASLLCNKEDNLNDKIKRLSEVTHKSNVIPNFITELA